MEGNQVAPRTHRFGSFGTTDVVAAVDDVVVESAPQRLGEDAERVESVGPGYGHAPIVRRCEQPGRGCPQGRRRMRGRQLTLRCRFDTRCGIRSWTRR